MNFGEKLQALRRARGWTQEELAAQIGVSRQALSKWEQDAAVPDTENVVRLSRLFGVTTDYLLTEESAASAPTAPQSAPSAARKRRDPWAVAGVLLAAVSAAGLLTMGILASVLDRVHLTIEDDGGIKSWGRLVGFLYYYHLHWLFFLLCGALAAGLFLVARKCLLAPLRAWWNDRTPPGGS